MWEFVGVIVELIHTQLKSHVDKNDCCNSGFKEITVVNEGRGYIDNHLKNCDNRSYSMTLVTKKVHRFL